jgi:hypothetical protein
MGLFDTVINHYKPLGPDFLATLLQTKDLSCSMKQYWISPNGELFEVNDDMTVDILPNPNFESELGNKHWVEPFIHAPNGKHGIVTPVDHTGQVRIYPANWPKDGYDNWPDRICIFLHGKLIEVLTP